MSKSRVSLTIDDEIVAEARSHGIDMSKVAIDAIVHANRLARNAAWVKENQAALDAYAREIEDEGCVLAEYRSF